MSSTDPFIKQRFLDVGDIVLHSRNQELELSCRNWITGGDHSLVVPNYWLILICFYFL